MATTRQVFTNRTGTGPFMLSAITFSTALPVDDQVAVVLNDNPVAAFNYTIVNGDQLVLVHPLVASDVLTVSRVTETKLPYSNYAAYGQAPAEGTLQNNQQLAFAFEELENNNLIRDIELQNQVTANAAVGQTYSALADDNFNRLNALAPQVEANRVLNIAQDNRITNLEASGGGGGGGGGAVDSVNGQTGVVSLDLDDIVGVNTDGVVVDQTLVYDGATWIPGTPAGGGGGADVQIVTSLPTSEQEAGDLVFLTGTGQAYFWSGSDWIAMGDANVSGQEPSVSDTLTLDYGTGNQGLAGVIAHQEANGWEVFFNDTTNGGSSSNYSYNQWFGMSAGATYNTKFDWQHFDDLTQTSIMEASRSYVLNRDSEDGYFLSDDTTNWNDTTSDADNIITHWASLTGDITPATESSFFGFAGKGIANINTELSTSYSTSYYSTVAYRTAMTYKPSASPLTDWEGSSWRLTLTYLNHGAYANEEYGLIRMGIYLTTSPYIFPEDFKTANDITRNSNTLFMGVANGWQSNSSRQNSTGAPTRAGMWMSNAQRSYTQSFSRDSVTPLQGMFGFGDAMPFFNSVQADSGMSATSGSTWDQGIGDVNPNIATNREYYSCMWNRAVFEWDHVTGLMTCTESAGPNFSPLGEAGTPGVPVVTTTPQSETDQIRSFLKSVTGLPIFLTDVGPTYNLSQTNPDYSVGFSVGPIKLERLS